MFNKLTSKTLAILFSANSLLFRSQKERHPFSKRAPPFTAAAKPCILPVRIWATGKKHRKSAPSPRPSEGDGSRALARFEIHPARSAGTSKKKNALRRFSFWRCSPLLISCCTPRRIQRVSQ